MAQLDEGALLCGRYTLIRRLGRGGMAEVWLADDAEDGGRVALKCLLPEFATQPQMLRLFEQEARRVARLDHPNIVRIRAFHGDASPPCFSMAAVEGPDLRAARGRPAAELAALLAPVADALYRVHALGLVHRDLKPSNVLLAADGRACLTDFGVAAALEAAPGELRIAGGGSDEFASPEQRAGQPPAVSDDAWGFGKLLEALLAPADRHGPLGELAARLTAAAPADRPADFARLREELRSIAGQRPASEALSVRRPEQLRQPGAAGVPAAAQGGGGARRLWGGLGGLLVLLAAVVFVLPDWVAERRAAAPPAERPSAASSAPVEAPADVIRRLVDARRAADAVRERLEPLREALEARAVEQWGRAEYAALLAGIVAGEGAYARRDYERALADWEQALAAAEALEQRRGEIVAEALATAGAALEAGRAVAATEAFGRAAAADPGNPAAARGLERAAVLDEVLAAMAAGTAAEREGRLEAARTAYAQAAALDGEHAAATAALRRVEAAAGEASFQAAMSRGYAALDAGNPAVARTAFEAARRTRPGSPEAAAGLAQAEALRREQAIRRLSDAAQAAEQREQWPAAAEAWRGVLAEDGAAPAARQGLARASARAELAARLEQFLADPFRLTQDEVFAAASATLAEARAAPAPAAALAARADVLDEALRLAATPVQVVFESDDRTEVLLHRIGRLGTFQRRALELKPGRYTAVGSRPGYRDVRREFVVEPGRAMPGPVIIRSEEPI